MSGHCDIFGFVKMFLESGNNFRGNIHKLPNRIRPIALFSYNSLDIIELYNFIIGFYIVLPHDPDSPFLLLDLYRMLRSVDVSL